MSAWDPAIDKDLQAVDVSHLFEASTTKIGFRRGTMLRAFMYDFIELFAPQLKRDIVEAAAATHNQEELEKIFHNFSLPTF